jgi:predicted DNA repair protein MutK
MAPWRLRIRPEGATIAVSGLLALLDDVAAIARLAASHVDDIAAHAARAGGKSAGVVIDDAAVTPKYVTGLPAARELPIVAKIATGSLISKLLILLPGLLVLQAFAPGAIAPLLILGGAYLCFEGAEKIWHALTGHEEKGPQQAETISAAHLEERRVKGAIKTDFILSAEIMTIALSTIEADNLWIRAASLAVIAIGFTVIVYGAVALLVKVDDFGVYLSEMGNWSAVRAFGRGLVHAMPTVLKAISIIGTAAMLWVGGNIVLHSLHTLHWSLPYEIVKDIAASIAGDGGSATLLWIVTAFLDAVFGFVLGSILIPVVNVVFVPFKILFPEK